MLPMLARGPFTDLRGTSKFAHGHHQRVFQEAALVEVIQQRRISAVKNRAMPILQQFEIKNMCVPTPVAVGREGFDVLAPVHLHIRHAGLHQAPGHQAALAKSRLAISIACLAFLLREIKRRARLGIRQQAVGALVRAFPVIDTGILQLPFGGVQLAEQFLAILNAVGRKAFEQFQCRNIRLPFLAALHEKRIVCLTQCTAAIAFNASRQIARDAVAKIKEWRQRIGVPAMFGDDGTEIRVYRGPFLKAREPHRASAGMTAVARLHGADHAEHVRTLGRLGQQLGEVHARRTRGDSAERTAKIAGRIRLGIEHIDMARASPKPQHDHRLGLGRLTGRPRLMTRSECHWQRSGSLQKRTSRLAATGIRLKISDSEHNTIFRLRKNRLNSLCHQANCPAVYSRPNRRPR